MPTSANVVLGQDVKIFQPDLVNLYGCTPGDETKVGAFVEVQKNVFIGRRCKISSHGFICVGSGAVILGGVTIGEGASLGAEPWSRTTSPFTRLQKVFLRGLFVGFRAHRNQTELQAEEEF